MSFSLAVLLIVPVVRRLTLSVAPALLAPSKTAGTAGTRLPYPSGPARSRLPPDPQVALPAPQGSRLPCGLPPHVARCRAVRWGQGRICSALSAPAPHQPPAHPCPDLPPVPGKAGAASGSQPSDLTRR